MLIRDDNAFGYTAIAGTTLACAIRVVVVYLLQFLGVVIIIHGLSAMKQCWQKRNGGASW